MCEQLAEGCYVKAERWELNRRPFSRKSNASTITPTKPHKIVQEVTVNGVLEAAWLLHLQHPKPSCSDVGYDVSWRDDVASRAWCSANHQTVA